jgi:putative sigma-54 modulation protein
MELKIRGDKIKITNSMKEYIEEKLGKLNKYLEKNQDITAHVIVKVKGHEQTVEITIPLKSFILRSEETQEDFYAAVDRTIDKLERQVRKNKTRLMSKHEKASYDFNFDNIVVDKKADKEQHKVVKRKSIEIKPMSEEEAFLQMELIGHEFFMYKDSETMEIAVVYKRKDGNYGVLKSE